MTGFKTVFFRECRRLFTTRDLALICVITPFLYGTVLPSIYAHKRVEKIPTGVVDLDASRLSRMMTRRLGAAQNIALTERYADADAALGALRNGAVDAFVYFPDGFSDEVKRGKRAMDIVVVNAANVLLANPVMQTVSELSGAVSAEMFSAAMMKRGVARGKAAALSQPFSVTTRVLFNPNLDYSSFMIPGLLFAVLQQILLVGLGYSLAGAFRAGGVAQTYRREGAGGPALMLGISLPYALLNFAIAVTFIFFFLPALGIPTAAKAGMIIPFTALFVFTITCLGMMLSLLFKSTTSALIVLMFYSMPTFLISGYSWPFFSLPIGLQIVGLLFPSTYYFDSFRLIILADLPAVVFFRHCLVLSVLAIFWGAAAALLVSRALRRASEK